MTLLELFKLIQKHLKIVVVVPVVLTVVVAAYAWIIMSDVYSASVSMYVLSTSESDSDSISSTDLSASQMIANDVATLITNERVLEDTASTLEMESLAGYEISVTSGTSTRVITLTVEGESAQLVASIANELAATTDQVAQEVMDVSAVNAIDQASVPTEPSGPPRMLYTALAFLAGIFVAIAIVVVMDMVNTRVRNPEEAEELLGLPVIGRIPTIKA